MNEKRFTIKEFSTLDAMSSLDVICDNGIELPSSTACDLLNELYEENNEIKQLIHRMLVQMDIEKINTENARYSARIIFTLEEFQKMRQIWKSDCE